MSTHPCLGDAIASDLVGQMAAPLKEAFGHALQARHEHLQVHGVPTPADKITFNAPDGDTISVWLPGSTVPTVRLNELVLVIQFPMDDVVANSIDQDAFDRLWAAIERSDLGGEVA